jgi:flavin-dependent dehydrogenase
VLLALKMAELAADSIHDAFKHNDFSGARLGQYQTKLDNGIESMRKLVYAFYNEGFSFSKFLHKYPEQRKNIISLLMGDVFKDGVDDIYGPMADFAVIPPPLYEQIDSSLIELEEAEKEEVLSAKYNYYDDRVLQETK